jgi:hypothetical protein
MDNLYDHVLRMSVIIVFKKKHLIKFFFLPYVNLLSFMCDATQSPKPKLAIRHTPAEVAIVQYVTQHCQVNLLG